jgi:hypothetical protein
METANIAPRTRARVATYRRDPHDGSAMLLESGTLDVDAARHRREMA